jgi:outer membrane protein assembly factor BamB
MQSRMLTTILLGLTFSVAYGETLGWPQFLGPRRDGVSSESKLAVQFPDSGPKIHWRIKGGVGMGGIAISAGKAYATLQESGRQKLIAVEANTGERLWAAELAPEYSNAMGDGPRATPTVDGNQVFAVTGEGIVVAVSRETGELQWKQDLPTMFECNPSEYGMSASPLVVGNLVVAAVGSMNAAIAALDRESGKIVWKAGSGPAGYSSPVQLKLGGVEQIVAFVGNNVFGADPQAGTTLWQYPYVTDYNCNTANPITVADKLFISSGENHGCVLLELKPKAGGFDATEVWQSQGGGSSFRCEWQTPVLIDGFLYGFDNVGSAGPITHLTCVEAATGKVAWSKSRFGKGNLIAAGKALLISTMEGELILANANPKSYEEFARAKVIGKTRQAPALADGLVYLRDDHEIVCVDLRAP